VLSGWRHNHIPIVEELLQKLVEGHLKHLIGHHLSIKNIASTLVTVYMHICGMGSLKLFLGGLLVVVRVLQVLDLNAAIGVVEVVSMVQMGLTTSILWAQE
jgi:hypothetical protein